MQFGTGEFSYTLNSRMQALAFQRLHPMLQDVVNHFKLPQDGIIRVVDLGCSIGANTLNVANVISSSLFTNGASEIQYFFNDLPTNDFNTLSNNFHLWTKCLFPQVIQDKTSGAYNKGQTFINEKNPKAFETCGEDFQTNLQKFFVHRAIELVSGGLLILIFAGRWTNLPTTKINDGSSHPSMDNFIDIAEASWEDLISEGLITTELKDSINVPIYLASMEEVRMALDETNIFVIQKFEMQKQIMSEVQGSLCENSKLFDDIVSNSWKAIYGEVIKVHIGEELANTYFQHLNKNLAKSGSKDWFNFMCEF
ncbi:hypothetical protein BDL97_15G097500 [Sphagnum fallax]|nr:hypothetical protein BDL97_15G097500 [Sphagnum fallax]